MNDLDMKIQKIEKWMETKRVANSVARVSLSENRLIFFSFSPPFEIPKGPVSTLLDLSHLSVNSMEKDMEFALNHIEKVAKNILNLSGEKR
jgi:hypothetical protein